MIKFGFSAYLRLICLNPKPQKSELRKRLYPMGRAYDFHRSLRLHVQRLMKGEDLRSVLSSAETITKKPERLSTVTGLKRFHEWCSAHDVIPASENSSTYVSDNELFSATYSPNLMMNLHGKHILVHIWNTKSPDLQKNLTLGALAIAINSFDRDRPDNAAILSLRDKALYWAHDIDRYLKIGTRTASAIDQLIQDIQDDARPSPSSERPAAPPPS